MQEVRTQPAPDRLSGRPPLVLCCGEALLDRLGPLGGDPATASLQEREDCLGGAPANVACGLARLGTPVAFLGRLGRDPIGAAFADLFAGRGVDTTGLQWDPLRPSRTVLVHRDRGGERHFGGFAGAGDQGFADQALDPVLLRQALAPLLARARWLQLGTLPLASEPAATALHTAVEVCAAAGVAVALDLNWRPTVWGLPPGAGPDPAAQAVIEPLLRSASLLKLAAEEAEWFFGSRDPAVIRTALPRRPLVVVTDGAAPLAWAGAATGPEGEAGEGEAGVGTLVPFPVEAVDSTGAGDAFTAGLLHKLCQGPTGLELALRFASACGALTCTGPGAIDPQPDAAAVDQFLQDRFLQDRSPGGV
jgi:fructokinase